MRCRILLTSKSGTTPVLAQTSGIEEDGIQSAPLLGALPEKAPVVIDLTTEDISPVQEPVLLRIKAIVDVEQLGVVEREMIIVMEK
ncbi:hypothetical protein BGX27_005684, partial [Mortierella sp. AM989]